MGPSSWITLLLLNWMVLRGGWTPTWTSTRQRMVTSRQRPWDTMQGGETTLWTETLHGALHASSPIITDIHFTYDMAANDLEGTSRRCSQERNTASHSREGAS